MSFLITLVCKSLSDLPTVDELGSAGLIDTASVESKIFSVLVNFIKRNKIIKMRISIQI